MEMVIDSTAILAVIAATPERNALVQSTAEAQLIAPDSLNGHIGNAFSAVVRQGKMSADQALQAIRLYKRIPIRFLPVELEESVTLASDLGISAYDAYLIRCALKYEAPLLSLDPELIKAARKMNVKIVEVAR